MCLSIVWIFACNSCTELLQKAERKSTMTKIGECVMLEEVQKVLMSEDCGKKHNLLFV